MKKLKKILAICLAMVLIGSAFTACGSDEEGGEAAGGESESKAISVLTREEGSGTRGAFIELFGIEQDDEDKTISSAEVTNSTSVMMQTVAEDVNSIGYISLGSLDESVTAVKIDGVEATAENVANGTYKVSRPFNIATKEGLSDAAQDFMNYIMSAEGQQVIEDEGYIKADDAAAAFTSNGASGSVTVAGSSSVTPVMEKLVEAYQAVNPNVTIEVQESDSTTGMQNAIDGLCDIGMASRDLKDSETGAGLTGTVIAQDGIAVIVNNDSGITELTSDQVKQVYLGEITQWEDLK